MEQLKSKGEFDGEYIDRIQEESEKFSHGRKREEEWNKKRKFEGSFESQLERLFREIEDYEIVDDW